MALAIINTVAKEIIPRKTKYLSESAVYYSEGALTRWPKTSWDKIYPDSASTRLEDS